MHSRIIRHVRRGLILLGVVALTLLAVRAYDSQRGAPLEPWHTYIPSELSADEIDAADWGKYLKAEQSIFDDLRREVTQKLEPEERVPVNRYFDGSPIYPGSFAQDWNRTYVVEPQGPPVGAVVFLHGLTDSPYSLRHIARHYRERGFVAVAIRLPGHGTVPGALTDVEWEDWMAATRLAVREARRRTGPSMPLHIVGFSNGGALAMKYALDALEDDQLAKPDRLILISPMIGITSFARFAGLAAMPAVLPAFAKAAWLSILPEFNPFKYNSFPVNGARQSHRLTVSLQERIARASREGRLDRLPPVLTFQSVLDFTVSTRAIISSLYAHLPANGSELVLFDLNRSAKFGLLFSTANETLVTRLLPNAPRRFRTTVITNASSDSSEVVAVTTQAGATTEEVQPMGLAYPSDVYSLSHVALPFPMSDALYGLRPEPGEDFGITLGSKAGRGERGALIIGLDSLLRMSSNPFFPYVISRIDADIDASLAAAKPSR
ncbi:alpha/beta hydrolase [Microvirga brassicacearum]|uniref:Alpha/beta hydrolase n=1 Tax=Microvirga brassicacearum TaxID=2580413 RepID=A0A5N3P641_9HYPH|nr:alpha/beta hydrolase [Microvirga brassicacearum]KAB0265196.1 alpha/beta hydrolase [Microvirga brassicacearum]